MKLNRNNCCTTKSPNEIALCLLTANFTIGCFRYFLGVTKSLFLQYRLDIPKYCEYTNSST